MDKKNKNPNVPNLRFNEFSLPWHQMRIIDLLSFQNGINGTPEQYGKGIKYISVGDILNNDYITYDKIAGSIDINQETLKNYSVTYGDILFQRSSEIKEDIGRTNVYLDKDHTATFGGFVIRGKKIGDYNPTFFNYLLKSPSSRQSIVRLGAGAQHYNIGQENIKTLNFYFPDEEEQQKIASLFSIIDERIQTQIKIINSIKSQIRTINNHIAFDSTSSELSIASLFHVKTSNKLVESNTGKFCIVDMGTIDANGNYIIGKYTDDETSLIPYGTLVMPKDDIGGGKIICKTMCINASNKYALSDHVFALKLKNDNYNPVYFSALINSQYNNHKLKKLVTGSAQLGINQENLNRYKLKFSDSLELQHKYGELIIRLNEKLIVEKRLLDLFSSQKKYLLKNMFV